MQAGEVSSRNVLGAASGFLFLVPILSTFGSATSATPESQRNVVQPNKPNIILIVADDLGFNDVPWHNNEVVAPNLQNLATEGIILEQSYVQPLCSPTRSALLSGTYPFAIGRQHNVIFSAMPTGLTLNVTVIPQLLKPLGYTTHAVGKWHLGFCNHKYTPTERGFDTFKGYYTAKEHYYSHIQDYTSKNAQRMIPDNPNHVYEKYDGTNIPNGYDFHTNKEPCYDAYGNYSTFLFASEVEDILRYRDSSVPKFVYMAFQSVHSPLEVPKKYLENYAHVNDKSRRTYLGMVTAMDDAIGRIITALKETNHYNNSVIIFTTDNGASTQLGGNNWPLRGNKSTLWEGGTRGAAFIHSPLLSNSRRTSNNLIHVTDWMATIVSLAGGILPPGTDSIDHWEAIAGNKKSPRREMIYNIDQQRSGIQAGIRVGNYKLLVGDPGPGDWLFPPEIRNKHTDESFLQNVDIYGEEVQKSNELSNMSLTDFETAEEMMKFPFRYQLFNVLVDPEERVNLAESKPDILITLVRRLLTYRDRYVTPDEPPNDPKANPKLWGGIWTPGWC